MQVYGIKVRDETWGFRSKAARDYIHAECRKISEDACRIARLETFEREDTMSSANAIFLTTFYPYQRAAILRRLKQRVTDIRDFLTPTMHAVRVTNSRSFDITDSTRLIFRDYKDAKDFVDALVQKVPQAECVVSVPKPWELTEVGLMTPLEAAIAMEILVKSFD